MAREKDKSLKSVPDFLSRLPIGVREPKKNLKKKFAINSTWHFKQVMDRKRKVTIRILNFHWPTRCRHFDIERRTHHKLTKSDSSQTS